MALATQGCLEFRGSVAAQQQDLAEMCRCFHHLMGLTRRFQRKGRVDDRLHRALIEERPDLGPQPLRYEVLLVVL